MIEFMTPEDKIIHFVSNRVIEKVIEKEQEILLLLLEDPDRLYLTTKTKKSS